MCLQKVLFVLSLLFPMFSNICFLQLVRRYTGGHKGSISCLMTFMATSGEVVLHFHYSLCVSFSQL